MGEVYYIFGDKNIPRAQVAFSSFVKAMSGYTRKKERKEDAMDEGVSPPRTSLVKPALKVEPRNPAYYLSSLN